MYVYVYVYVRACAKRPANSLGAEINTALHSHFRLAPLPPVLQAAPARENFRWKFLLMRGSTREKENERDRGERERERERRRDKREQNSERRRGMGNMGNLPRRVSPKSDAFFQFPCSSCQRVATFLSPRSLPSTLRPLLSSHSQVFWSFEQAGALLFLPILLILLPCFRIYPSPPTARVIPFSILPSFMFFRALSHLSAVSTSISKKSSRELFVGKCREPAVLRARVEIEVRKANEIKKNDVEEKKKVWRRTTSPFPPVPSRISPSIRRLRIFFSSPYSLAWVESLCFSVSADEDTCL